jgi:hypothetical protein
MPGFLMPVYDCIGYPIPFLGKASDPLCLGGGLARVRFGDIIIAPVCSARVPVYRDKRVANFTAGNLSPVRKNPGAFHIETRSQRDFTRTGK